MQDAIEECRKLCGGHGYLNSSGLPELFAVYVPACTYEGDNVVLLLQVSMMFLGSDLISFSLLFFLNLGSLLAGCKVLNEDCFSVGLWEATCWYNSIHGQHTVLGAMQECCKYRYSVKSPGRFFIL
jgi:hypothetical protein